MTAIPKPTNTLRCVLIFLSLFSAYSTKKDDTPWLERSVQTLVEGFRSIAKNEGNKETMNVDELEEYMRQNTPETLQGQDPDFVRRTFESLDENRDGELQHPEFVKLQMQYMVAKYNQKHKPQK